MGNHLQPFVLFRHEQSRLNDLYWTSKYAATRTVAVLRALASTGHAQPDPRTDVVWPPIDAGEARHITGPVSAFIRALENNADAIRTTSILHLCSAFETALANYYALCALYRPTAVTPTTKMVGVPAACRTPTQFETLKKWAVKKSSTLGGKYSARLNILDATFGLGGGLALPQLTALDDYYKARHLIAHDQALAAADAPDLSAKDIIATRLKVTEVEWKTMLDDFAKAVESVDASIQKNVVKDRAVPLAVFRILQRDGVPVAVGVLRHRVNLERNLLESYQTVHDAVAAMGYSISREKAIFRRTIT